MLFMAECKQPVVQLSDAAVQPLETLPAGLAAAKTAVVTCAAMGLTSMHNIAGMQMLNSLQAGQTRHTQAG